MHEPTSSLSPAPTGKPSAPPAKGPVARILTGITLGVVILALAGVAGAFWMGFLHLPAHGPSGQEDQEERKPLNVELAKDKPYTLEVPGDTRLALGIAVKDPKTHQIIDRLETARRPRTGWPLELPGSTMLDPARILRIRARFAPAEVISIHKTTVGAAQSGSGTTEDREIRPGDTIKKGEELGVFYSVDVGSKKNDLFDAVLQLKLDREILDRAESARGSVPEAFILNARRNVQGDYNAINRAESTLRAWNVPESDIRAVRKEAEQAAESPTGLDKKVTQEQLDRWARVVLRAPEKDDGVPWTLVERNVAQHEIIVDPTTNLFVLAKVDRLSILAYAPEDNLRTLENVMKSGKGWWTVHTAGLEKQGMEGRIEEIGYIVDPNQHAVVLKGHLENPGGRLRGGQYLTCTINLEAPDDVVEIPMSAVVDDGKETVVFVEEDPNKPGVYTLRRVKLTARFETRAFVSSKLTEEDVKKSEQDKKAGLPPLQTLQPGDRVVLQGALELKKELEDREANAASEQK
jgi:cobalt-zinc-cadmium efflux system membrane fusion protein